jgi:hypothetical protein
VLLIRIRITVRYYPDVYPDADPDSYFFICADPDYNIWCGSKVSTTHPDVYLMRIRILIFLFVRIRIIIFDADQKFRLLTLMYIRMRIRIPIFLICADPDFKLDADQKFRLFTLMRFRIRIVDSKRSRLSLCCGAWSITLLWTQHVSCGQILFSLYYLQN